ncbi:hypothetical protein BKA83DRAFT_4341575 [Pisolithus microcarpus]|nr:hypothetical protein BKA83DRAFT_4341575 [Pisolithus microcarpus]
MPLASTCVCALFCAITHTLCASFKLPVLSVFYVLVVFLSSGVRFKANYIFNAVMFSSKSHNKHIWDRPWLLDSATYKLNRLRAPDREVWQCQF